LSTRNGVGTGNTDPRGLHRVAEFFLYLISCLPVVQLPRRLAPNHLRAAKALSRRSRLCNGSGSP
jgi:hypothetical protein